MDETQPPSIQDISKAVDSATGFAKVIAEVFPGIAERSLIRAERKATSAMLKDLEKVKTRGEEMGLSDDYIGSLCSDIVLRYTRNERLMRTAQFASERIPEDFEPQAPIDHEWAENFREHAEKASDEDAQRLWGAILAQEAQEPGTVSKRTMRILADMSKNEALSFKRLCGFATTMLIEGEIPKGYYDPFIILHPDKSGGSYNSGAVGFRELANLADIGLVDRSTYYRLVAPAEFGCPIKAGDYIVVLKAQKEASPTFSLTEGVFTACGKELSRICGIGGDPALADAIEAMAESKGLSSERFWAQPLSKRWNRVPRESEDGATETDQGDSSAVEADASI